MHEPEVIKSADMARAVRDTNFNGKAKVMHGVFQTDSGNRPELLMRLDQASWV